MFKSLPSIKSEEGMSCDENKSESIDGRVRSYPHQRNQFSIHIYIKLNENNDYIIEDLKQTFNEKSDENNIHFEDIETHISLIRGHYCLRFHQIDSFIDSLKQRLKSIFCFTICLNAIKVFANEEKTRNFITVCESTPNLQSKQVIEAIDSVLNEFNCNVFGNSFKTDEHLYHTSIAWFLPKYSDSGLQLAKDIEHYFDEPLIIKVSQICVKIGNICKTIYLNNL